MIDGRKLGIKIMVLVKFLDHVRNVCFAYCIGDHGVL